MTQPEFGQELMLRLEQGLQVQLSNNSAPAIPVQGRLEHEYGYGQQLPFTSWGRENNGEVYADDTVGPSLRQLMVMRRTDGQARALFRLITGPIRSALRESTFQPADGGEKEAQFINQVFTLPPTSGGMTQSFAKFLDYLLLAISDGFAAFEEVYWRPTEGPLAGKITVQKYAFRPPETITFRSDKNGGFNGFVQRVSVGGEAKEITIPLDYSFYYAVNEAERKFYGLSYFSSAYYHWDKKVKIQFLWHLAAQRAAVGTRIVTHPKGINWQAKAALNRAAADFGTQQHMVVPEGIKVDSLKEGGTFNFAEAANYHDSQMSKSILANFFDKDQGGTSSVVSFGEQSDDFFIQMLQGIMEEIAALINHHLIPKLIQWNFNSDKYPTFRWGAFTDEQKDLVKNAFDRLAAAGDSASVSPEFMLELEKHMAEQMGFEIDYEEIAKREEEARLAQEAAAKILQDQQLAAAQAQAATQGAGNPADSEPASGGKGSMTPDQLSAELGKRNGAGSAG